MTQGTLDGKTSLTQDELVDKVEGVIFGAAIGDGVGLSTEFMPKQQATTLYGNGPIKFGNAKGHEFWRDSHRSKWFENEFTDDTDQMLLILQGLLADEGIINPINFAFRLKEWSRLGFPDLNNKAPRGIGFTVGSTFSHDKFLADPFSASFDVWNASSRNLAANGAVMRTGIVGVPQFWREKLVAENAMLVAKVTHADPRSVASAVIVSVVISRMLRGSFKSNPSEEIDSQTQTDLTKVLEAGSQSGDTSSFLEKFKDCPKAIPKKMKTQPGRYLLRNIGRIRSRITGEPVDLLLETDFNIPKYPPVDSTRLQQPAPIRPNVTKMDEMGIDREMMDICEDVVSKYKFLVEANSLCPNFDDEKERRRGSWVEELKEHCFPSSLSSLKLDEGGKIGYTLKCLGAGLYTATRKKPEPMSSPEFCKHLLTELTLQVGDADTNCAVAGALLGCRVGKSGLPKEWVEGLRHKEFLQNLANQLCTLVLESMKE